MINQLHARIAIEYLSSGLLYAIQSKLSIYALLFVLISHPPVVDLTSDRFLEKGSIIVEGTTDGINVRKLERILRSSRGANQWIESMLGFQSHENDPPEDLNTQSGQTKTRGSSQINDVLLRHLEDAEPCHLSEISRSQEDISDKFSPDSDRGNNDLWTSASRTNDNALICVDLNERNYRTWISKMYKFKNYRELHQIHFVSSNSIIALSAMDPICSSFNCSTLTMFKFIDHQLLNHARLAHWLNRFPALRILDLSNTSLKFIESIFNSTNYRPADDTSLTIGRNSSAKALLEDTAHLSQNPTNDRTLVDLQKNYNRPLAKPFQKNVSHQVALKSLTQLVLDFNDITRLDFDFLLDKIPNLKNISLVNNSVYNIDCSEDYRSRFSRQIEYINLANNSINCNKSHMWILTQFLGPSASSKFPDHDQIRCSSISLADMTWSQRVSVLETRICDDCDCRSLKRTAISVDCHNKGLTSLPDVLPLNTKILNLTNNHINSLKVPSHARNWENVTYVYLENNLISSFNPLELTPKFMRNLAALDIRQNKFQEFPSHILEQYTNLDQIHLSNNPWLCDCESTFAFQEWLQRHFHKVGDKEEIRCGISGNEENGLRSTGLQQRLSSRVIYKLAKSELCPQDNLEEPYDWLDVVNVSLAATIILILAKLLMDFIYQHRTKRLPHFFKINI